MTVRRISRGTPYIQTATEIEEVLKHLAPRMELAIAALFNMTVDEWRKQPAKLRVKQVLDHQNSGAFAATLAASEKAIGDLEAAALPTIQPTEVSDTLLDAVIDRMHQRGLIIANPTTTSRKGA